MYNRLLHHRPDLRFDIPGHSRDVLLVYLKDNAKFGSVSSLPSKHGHVASTAPSLSSVLLNESDIYNPPPNYQSLLAVDLPLHELARCFIHIPMRNCWMEDLEPYIRMHPIHMAFLAIKYNHLDFLKILVDDRKLVGIAKMPLDDHIINSLCYHTPPTESNLKLFRYLHSKGSKIPSSDHLYGYLMQYPNGEHDHHFIRNGETFKTIRSTKTMDTDFWLWYWDVTSSSHDTERFNWFPIIKTKQEAIKVVKKLESSSKSLDIDYLFIITANQGSLESYTYIWEYFWSFSARHKPKENPTTTTAGMHLDPRIAMTAMISNYRAAKYNLHGRGTWNRPCINALRHAHQYEQSTSRYYLVCTPGILRSMIHDCSSEYVIAMCKSCHHFEYTKEIIDGAAFDGKLDLVRFFGDASGSGYGLEYTTNAIDFAAANGHVDVILYLLQKRESAGFTRNAVKNVAVNDQLDVLKILLDERYVGMCRVEIDEFIHGQDQVSKSELAQIAFETAVVCGRLRIVQYLVSNNLVTSCAASRLQTAVERGQYFVISYLYENVPGCRMNFTSELVGTAVVGGNLRLVRYLVETCELTCPVGILDHFMRNWKSGNRAKVLGYLLEQWGRTGIFNDALQKIYRDLNLIKDREVEVFLKINERSLKDMIAGDGGGF
ncbi:hypothetical protein HDU76_010876 [Blyttiomyces sp. JEL0837]|nr:hypothetical protein HDU76_010876 [Blyttiomyces sp. JEL0837]